MALPAVEPDDSILPMVIKAQEQNADRLSGLNLRDAAERLVSLARSLDYPLLLPVSRDAERLVGAALLLGGMQVEAITTSTFLAGKRVLLVDAVVVHMSAVESAALIAERAGAVVVGAAVLDRLADGPTVNVPVHELVAA
jgi:hypothetical protein